MTTANNYDGEDFCCTDAAPCSVHQLPAEIRLVTVLDAMFETAAAPALGCADAIADGPEPCQICGAWTYSLLCARCEALA